MVGAHTVTSPHVVTARALSKSFGELVAVRGIDLDVRRGGCFGLLGPNGAGKTTTLRMLLGLCTPSGGTLHVLGLPMPERGRQIRARLGVVPQMDNLDPDFTVLENLRVYASYFGLSARDVTGRIAKLLELVELSDRAYARLNTLSGGMKRRLSIARALVNDPDVLILDEPTTGLDPQVRHLIWTRLRELKRAGTTMILTTHYMEEAQRLCDVIAIMDHGAVIAQGSPRELIRDHVEPDVIEIHDHAAELPARLGAMAGVRAEQVGETLYAYTGDARGLVAELEKVPGINYLHRPASLEDVFLRLTGRDLRE
jgi:lipooligosaccharide transport system ATP-binding protein